jgi:N6-adenosine-specific RNA methylase IME4
MTVDDPIQPNVLFESGPVTPVSEPTSISPWAGEVVKDLNGLIESGAKFHTIYADPPWTYRNRSSRGAAANHYKVMTYDEIVRLPVQKLAHRHAHLHLWVTSSFLQEGLNLIEAWGFCYKSSFVWVKDKLGCGNYWRLSHEFLLLGVRGNLRYRDRSQRSWLEAKRFHHSHKPGLIRPIIERVSPGPYLELFGREAVPKSHWTIFGNQVEPRLF